MPFVPDQPSVGQFVPDAPAAPQKPVTYDAAEFERRVGRAPEPAELQNFIANKGAGWAGDTSGSMSGAQVALQSPRAAADIALSGGTGLALAIPAAARYAYYLGHGLLNGHENPHEYAKARANDVLQYVHQPGNELGRNVLGTVGDVAQAPIQTYGAAAQDIAAGLQKVGVPGLNPEATGQLATKEAEGAALLSPLAVPAEGAAFLARNPGKVVSAAKSAGRAIVDRLPDPEAAPVNAQAALEQAAAASPQSQGAAAAALQVQSASPELQAAVHKSLQENGSINIDATQRQLQAERVGSSLSEGQATQHPVTLSEERNEPQMAEFFNKQNREVKGTLENMRDEVAPQAFTTTPVEHGKALIDAYKAKDAALSGAIDQAYNAARKGVPTDASIIDAPQLLATVTKGLHKELLFDDAPQGVMRTLQRLADNNSLTFENLESLRTNLARIMRSHTIDGNTKHAAGIIRDALEQAPLAVPNEAAKGMFDQARALARGRFQMLEDDPAFKAAVYDKVPPDNFVQTYLTGSSRSASAEQAATMARNLGDSGQQTMRAAVIDHLRDRGGLGSDYSGTLRNAGYNRALQGLQTKLGAFMDRTAAEKLQDIGDTLRNQQQLPEGHFVSTAHTAPALVHKGAEVATDVLATKALGPLSFLAKGPIKNALQNASGARRVARATRAGAGVDFGVSRPSSPAVQAMLTAAKAKAAEEAALGAALKRTAHAAHQTHNLENQS